MYSRWMFTALQHAQNTIPSTYVSVTICGLLDYSIKKRIIFFCLDTHRIQELIQKYES